MDLTVCLPPKLSILFQPARYKVAYGGRGSGKSWGVARALLTKGLEKRLRILCAREIQRTIADSVHRLLSDQIAELGFSDFYSITETAIRGYNGTEFFFAGLRTQDIGKLKSYEGVEICWVEEAQTVSNRSWDVLIPTIRAEHSEIWVTFNPELDTDPTYQRFVVAPPEDCLSTFINYADNPWFPLVLEKERLALKKRDPEAYENVWEGKCRAAVEGAIYTRELADLYAQKRVRAVPYDPMLQVHAVWDLGWNDQTSIILVQRSASEIRVIGYMEDTHRTLADYVKDLEALPYRWGHDWLPHDGRAKDYKSGKSAEEILTAMGRRPRIVENIGVEEGIRAARMVFPRTYVDDSASRLLHCLKRYRRTIHPTTNEPGPPLHDENSHGADAFRYLAVCVDQLGNDVSIADPYASFRRRA